MKKNNIIDEKSISTEVDALLDKIDTGAMMQIPISNWRLTLATECQVYVCGESYLAKKFDQINYKFCTKDEAKEILIDNLYALLRYKYFPSISEDIDDRIQKIVSNFTTNIKTTLEKVSFDEYADCNHIKMLPDYCIAFRNGVYNFKDGKWLFRYNVVELEGLSNKIYLYTKEYVVLWYMDYNFEPLDFKITDVSIGDFIEIMKELTKVERNYAFELLWNISHNAEDKFDFKRFKHLCEIIGYTCLQSFNEEFVMLIGTGQNGKNSLFDGCFTSKVVPKPINNSLEDIEEDKFITGSLENRYHNFFFETEEKTHSTCKVLKNITGSMYQTIHSKGVMKYSGIINCKWIFSANDQDKVKFSDTSTGFRRRINMMEIYYRWDKNKRFMKGTDYFDTTFSDSLAEIRNNPFNTTIFLYFAMYGIMFATKNFTENFKFSSNDWNETYTDIDLDLKERINGLDFSKILSYIKGGGQRAYNECEDLFYDLKQVRLSKSNTLKQIGYEGYDEMISALTNEEIRATYFADNDVLISVRILQNIIRDIRPAKTFSQDLKKTFNLRQYITINNRPYIKVSFIKNKMKIME